MKLYELFKGAEYIGEFTLDEIISITGAHRSALLNSVAHGVLVNDLWDVSPAYDRTLNRNDDNSLLNGRNSQRDRVYSDDGLAPTISTKPGGNTEPKIVIPVLTPDRGEKRQNGRRFKEDGEPMFTLTSQDRHGVATSLNPLGGLYTGVSKEFYRGIYEGCFRCLKASTHDSGVALKLNVLNINSNKGIFVRVSDELIVYAVWYEKYQCYIAIRKLTPKECFRLQGWTDDYFEKSCCITEGKYIRVFRG